MDDPDKCDMTLPFELHGNWWNQGEPADARVAGCLSYTPDYGMQLKLYDDLPGDTLARWKSSAPIFIWGEVWGVAGKQVKVSLLHLIETNRPNDPAEEMTWSHTIFFVNRMILGAHVTNENSVALTSIHFSFTDLESFANTKPVGVDLGRNVVGVGVEYIPAERPETHLRDSNMTVRIATLVESNSSLFDRHCTITWRDEIIAKLAEPAPLDICMEVVHSLENFLLMCARENVEIRYIRGRQESGDIISCVHNPGRRSGRITARDWLLKLDDISAHLERVISAWFALLRKLRFVGSVFFSELKSPSPVQDARFFHLAGCLEAFHREIVQADAGKFLPKVEYKQIVEEILKNVPASIPVGLNSAIQSSLSRANDHSFAERVGTLFNSLESETKQQLADEPDRFLSCIKRSRNKLAHVTEQVSGETFEGREYGHANLSIRGWLTILILRECGISESLILQRMRAINYFYWGPFKFDAAAES